MPSIQGIGKSTPSQLCIVKLDHQYDESAQELQALEQVDRDAIMTHIILPTRRNSLRSIFQNNWERSSKTLVRICVRMTSELVVWTHINLKSWKTGVSFGKWIWKSIALLPHLETEAKLTLCFDISVLYFDISSWKMESCNIVYE